MDIISNCPRNSYVCSQRLSDLIRELVFLQTVASGRVTRLQWMTHTHERTGSTNRIQLGLFCLFLCLLRKHKVGWKWGEEWILEELKGEYNQYILQA